jgi:hypothetical protein
MTKYFSGSHLKTGIYECWKVYDDKGRVIYMKNMNDFEWQYKYDDLYNQCIYENSDGLLKITKYDDDGNIILEKVCRDGVVLRDLEYEWEKQVKFTLKNTVDKLKV